MRLINVFNLKLQSFVGEDIPPYATLSHTWGREEVTFTEFTMRRTELMKQSGSLSTEQIKAFRKILFCCEQAKKDGWSYIWVDTCCIDKSSSAEVSEALNSMFTLYRNCEVCYAYLEDVETANFVRSFTRSRWFTRGWTLQELIAPRRVIFFGSKWEYLGDKSQLAAEISAITGIDVCVLDPTSQPGSGGDAEFESFPLRRISVAQKMCWASERETTLLEDVAYSLLGLFDVNMPLLYGEGQKAFRRLQEEILKKTKDQSIFAWGRKLRKVSYSKPRINLFASSPADFLGSEQVRPLEESESLPHKLTNIGLKITLPVLQRPLSWIALLSCGDFGIHQYLGMELLPLNSPSVQDKQPRIFARMVVGDPGVATCTVHPLEIPKARIATLYIEVEDSLWLSNKLGVGPLLVISVNTAELYHQGFHLVYDNARHAGCYWDPNRSIMYGGGPNDLTNQQAWASKIFIFTSQTMNMGFCVLLDTFLVGDPWIILQPFPMLWIKYIKAEKAVDFYSMPWDPPFPRASFGKANCRLEACCDAKASPDAGVTVKPENSHLVEATITKRKLLDQWIFDLRLSVRPA